MIARVTLTDDGTLLDGGVEFVRVAHAQLGGPSAASRGPAPGDPTHGRAVRPGSPPSCLGRSDRSVLTVPLWGPA